MDDSPEARYLTVVIQMLEDLPEDDHFRVDILIVDAKRLLTTMILNNLQKAFEFDDNSDNELEYKPRKLSKINDTNLRRIRSSLLGIRALLLYFGKQQAAQNMLMLLAQEGLTAEDEVAQALLAVEPKLPDFYETGSLNTSDNNKILVNTAKDISQNFESDSRILLQQLTIYSHNKLGTPIINNTNESFVGTSKSNTDSKIMIRNNENIPDVLLQNSVVNKNAENILSELSYNENEHINIKWSKNQIEANSKKKIRLPLEQSRSSKKSIATLNKLDEQKQTIQSGVNKFYEPATTAQTAIEVAELKKSNTTHSRERLIHVSEIQSFSHVSSEKSQAVATEESIVTQTGKQYYYSSDAIANKIHAKNKSQSSEKSNRNFLDAQSFLKIFSENNDAAVATEESTLKQTELQYDYLIDNNSIPAETTITYKNSNEIKRQSSENRNNMFELDNQNRTITSNIESSLSNDLMHEKRSSSAYERSINFPVRSIGAKLVNMDSQNTDFLETESVDSKIRCNSKADIEMKGTVKKTTFDNSIIFQRKNSSRQISPVSKFHVAEQIPITIKQLFTPPKRYKDEKNSTFLNQTASLSSEESLKSNQSPSLLHLNKLKIMPEIKSQIIIRPSGQLKSPSDLHFSNLPQVPLLSPHQPLPPICQKNYRRKRQFKKYGNFKRQQIQQNNYWWTPIATKQLTVPVPKIECGSDLHFVARAIINMEALKGNPR